MKALLLALIFLFTWNGCARAQSPQSDPRLHQPTATIPNDVAIQPVFFGDGWNVNDLTVFFATLNSSSYFSPLSIYGVDSVTVLPPVTDSSSANLTAAELSAVSTYAPDEPIIFTEDLGGSASDQWGWHGSVDGHPYALVYGRATEPTLAATHEMVEMLTDPNPPDQWFLPGKPESEEIADHCQPMTRTLSHWTVSLYYAYGHCV